MLQTTGPRWGWRHDSHKTITWRYIGIAWTRSKIVTKWHYKIKYQHSYCTCFTEVLYFQSNCSFSIAKFFSGLSSRVRMFPYPAREPREALGKPRPIRSSSSDVVYGICRGLPSAPRRCNWQLLGPFRYSSEKKSFSRDLPERPEKSNFE